MRVAIIHDWLVTYAGAERVLEQILECYPSADLFAVVDFLPKSERSFLQGRKPGTTFVQRLPFSSKVYRSYLPFMPLAIENLDLSSYDLIISSSHAVAKGVLTGPDQLHISYVYSPMRYAWDLQHQYLAESGRDKGIKRFLTIWMLQKMRLWDSRTANGVDKFITLSRYVARRIRKIYRRDATVIYPPVDIQKFDLCESKEDFYLTASRMVPYKKLPLIVRAFASTPERRLIVVGDGPDMRRVREAARNSTNIEILGFQPLSRLREFMMKARAFVFAAEEDFGIVVVEAQACGTPVIAFGKGGVREIVRGLDSQDPTGVFFGEQNVPAIVAAVESFEANAENIDPVSCRKNALRFGVERFRTEFQDLVEAEWRKFQDAHRL